MKRTFNFTTLITSAVCLIPIAISAFFYDSLPDKVATHWNFSGVADGFSSKAFAAFGIPLIMLAFHIIFCFAVENDPKRVNMSKAMKNISKWIIPILSILVQLVIIINALGRTFDPAKYVTLFVGALIFIIGIYMPKSKQNYTIGIRVPWTLHSEENWDKTHKLAGGLWTVGGILTAAAALLPAPLPWLFFAVIIAISVIPIGYSYFIYSKDKK